LWSIADDIDALVFRKSFQLSNGLSRNKTRATSEPNRVDRCSYSLGIKAEITTSRPEYATASSPRGYG